MKAKLLIVFICVFAFIFQSVDKAFAIENPFASFNNKFGIHILFTTELQKASELVNSSGGEWGYVTIPIQAGDKDIVKWQNFMNEAGKLRLIPILRLATENDYFNTKVWRKPTEADVVDFANFLNSIYWPVRNRYIIVFNEVNRADEWGGEVNAEEYAKILAYATNVFKSKSQDFFVISSGMDNAAPENPPQFKNQYNYLREMNDAVPGVFNQIDGLSSHSYPNPAFSQPPTLSSKMGINSFTFERELVRSMSSKDLPIFITETGWSKSVVSEDTRADYYRQAFANVWSDNGVAAVTPFLLQSNGAFEEFSFVDGEGKMTDQFEMIKSLPKVKGMPVLNKKPVKLLKQQKKVLGLSDGEGNIGVVEASGYRDFSKKKEDNPKFSLRNMVTKAFFWLIGT